MGNQVGTDLSFFVRSQIFLFFCRVSVICFGNHGNGHKTLASKDMLFNYSI